jgi:hypothetical protein
VRDGGNLRPLCFPDLADLHHEGDRIVLFKPFADRLWRAQMGEGAK